MMKSIILLLQAMVGLSGAYNTADAPPIVEVANGSYYGLHNSHFYQDHFLGIPYALPPIGDLRYRPPASLNTSWPGTRNATEYGYACMGYGVDTEYAARNYTSEDCLTLNVVRPAGKLEMEIPVAVWIHGGAYISGSAFNPQYNTSFIVEQSVIIGQPILVVSIQYRLAGWGYLWSEDIVAEGAANLGVRDQYMALRWIHENIAAFGGDPTRVTIWGESAGSFAVGDLMLAYNGRDNKLFSAAIGQSGAATGIATNGATPELAQLAFDNVTAGVGCASEERSVECLRKVPTELLNVAINASQHITAGSGKLRGYSPLVYGPQTDGDIVAQDPIVQMAAGNFVKVPFLTGDTNNEGTAFAPWGLDTDEDFVELLRFDGCKESETLDLLDLYPHIQPPQADPEEIAQLGNQFERVGRYLTDALMKAPRRLAARYWFQHANGSAPMYTYNWNASLSGVPNYWGSTHAADLPYVFYSVDGGGYENHSLPYYGPNLFLARPKSYYDLADSASRMWISFINTHDPNYFNSIVPSWPPQTSSNLKVMDFQAEGPRLINDIYREEPMSALIRVMLRRSGGFSLEYDGQ